MNVSPISFKDPERMAGEWANQTDERLKFLLRGMAVFMEGLRITELVRTEAENINVKGKSNSKHLLDLTTGKCSAADLNPPFDEKEPDYWRVRFKAYIHNHFKGVEAVIHKGTAIHVHLEIDLKDGQEVVLLG